MANVEHQLMFMYDSDVTRHLVNELIVNQGKPPQYVMQLNEKVATSCSFLSSCYCPVLEY